MIFNNHIFKSNNWLLILKIALIVSAILKFIYLDRIPIFADEANHLRMADIVRKNPSEIISFTKGGILPGLIIVLALLENIFKDSFNIFFVARAFSGLCEILSSYFIYLIGLYLFNPITALISAILYLLIPFNNFHGRLVMLEPLMSVFFLSSLYYFIRVIDKLKIKFQLNRLYKQIILIICLLILAFITKPLVIVSLGAFITLPFVYRDNNSSNKSLWKILALTAVIIIFFSLAIAPFSLLSSGHFYNDYILRNINVILHNFKMNLWRSYLWIKIYYPLLILISSFIGAVYGIVSKNFRIIWVLSWAISVIVLDSVIGGKLFYPRHLFPLSIPLVYLAAIPLSYLYKTRLFFLKFMVIIYLLFFGMTSFKLISQPQNAILAPEDRQQFFEDWPSGMALEKIAYKLKSLSKDQMINVYVSDEAILTWALPNIFEIGQTKIIPINSYLGGETTIDLEKEIQRGENQYLILNKEPYPPHNFKAKFIVSYPKGPNRNIVLYHLEEYD